MATLVSINIRVQDAQDRSLKVLRRLVKAGDVDLGELELEVPTHKDPDQKRAVQAEWMADVLEALSPSFAGKHSELAEAQAELEEAKGIVLAQQDLLDQAGVPNPYKPEPEGEATPQDDTTAPEKAPEGHEGADGATGTTDTSKDKPKAPTNKGVSTRG
jgi:hypothetical protein